MADEDAISRHEAIDAIYACYIGGKEAVDKAPYSDHYAEGIDEAVTAVEELHSVSTEKTGWWKKISPANIYECSECGQNVMTDDICAYKFCHGCGAKMEVEE